METAALTVEMVVVLSLLGFTVFLFVSEIVRIDLAAISIMVVLGMLSYVPGLGSLVDVNHLFDGFASNAVISIIAVMIIGAGLDKTGLVSKAASVILKYGGSTEGRIIPIVCGTVGVISSFMQNVGAAALFLPVVSRISTRTKLPLSRLLMPMGFCAILGGTMTLVGSSPLILLNDLIIAANVNLPAGQKMAPFSLFSVAPVGIALIFTGILYFVCFGRWILPKTKAREDDGASGRTMEEYLEAIYDMDAGLIEIEVPEDSSLNGMTLEDLRRIHKLIPVGYYHKGKRVASPVLTTEIATPCKLVIIGHGDIATDFAKKQGLKVLPELDTFADVFALEKSGVAEVVIPPDSKVIGKSARQLVTRATFGFSMLSIRRGEETLSDLLTDDGGVAHVGHVPLRAGDTLAIFTSWEALTRLKSNRSFVIVTVDFPQEELRPQKVSWALGFFAIALVLILFSDIRLSLCLLVGAVGMMTSRVLTVDEAYNAVGWNTVFLLASLIPLGQAVQNSGTAAWIASQILVVLDGWPILALQTGIAILATVFTLVMSNVGATVLLVPLAVSIATTAGGDPAMFALTVAISTSNSFLIPTHQVNALIMGPAGYKVIDFVRTGGVMTVLFLVVSLAVLNLFW